MDQERGRRQRGFEQNHLVQVRRLRNRPERLCLFDPRGGDQARTGERAQSLARMCQMFGPIAQVRAEGDEGSFN